MTTTEKTIATIAAETKRKAPRRKARDKTEADVEHNARRNHKRAIDSTKKQAAKTKAARAGSNTFTTVEIAAEHDMNAKTLRARIRRNMDKWEPLFADGVKHVYKDNVTTRKAVAALLDA